MRFADAFAGGFAVGGAGEFAGEFAVVWGAPSRALITLAGRPTNERNVHTNCYFSKKRWIQKERERKSSTAPRGYKKGRKFQTQLAFC